MEKAIFSVAEINNYVSRRLREDRTLANVLIRGEVSGFKTYSSGHSYFTLKDAGAAMRATLFREQAKNVRFRPTDGMQVVVAGRVELYTVNGEYRVVVTNIIPEGVGDLHLAYEQMKARLEREGLFDEAHKKPIPRTPGRIALVTSPVGAAVRDMIRILGARWPMTRVFVVPCRVQGDQAAPEIAGAIRQINEWGCADLMIVGRGGGSMEDLWCFNDERVARAIYASEIPIISAVGHEPDFTIADYVADLRAATPSNGAELAVPDQSEQAAILTHMGQRMAQAMQRQTQMCQTRLDRIGQCRMLRDPMSWVYDRQLLLDRQQERLVNSVMLPLNKAKSDLSRLAATLDALSPLKVLGRGYAITKDAGGTVVKSVGQVKHGDPLTVRVSDGNISCRVE